MDVSKDAIRKEATDSGIDVVGFVCWEDLEQDAPSYDKPSQLTTYLKTLIVMAKRYPTGVACSPDESVRQYAMGRTSRHLEDAASRVAYWLEEQDVMAALLSATFPDLRRQPIGYAGPAGQGSLLLRHAAVRAGLGSLGLNLMLLTPDFGPRIFLSGILTDLDVEPDSPFADELCPGLEECGRCAAVCPEQAIPTQSRQGASLAQIRDLDEAACVRSSQPYGPDRMVEHLQRIFTSSSGEEAARIAKEKTTLKLWYNLTVLRHGAFTGCGRCELVCPVGQDYPVIESSSARQQDLPHGVVREVVADQVSVQNVAKPSG